MPYKVKSSDSGQVYTFADDVSEDDALEYITGIETKAEWGDVARSGLQRGASSLKRQAAGVAEFAGDITGWEGAKQTGVEMKAAADAADAAVKPAGVMSRPQEWTESAIASTVSATPYVVGGLGLGTAKTLAGLAAGTPGALQAGAQLASRALIPMAAGVGAEKYGELRGEGFGVGRSALHGLAEGAFEYAGERLPVGHLIKSLGGEQAIRKVLAGWFGRELLGEEFTTFMQLMNAKMSNQPDLTPADFARAAVDTAAVTAMIFPMQGAIVAPIAHASNALVRREMERQAENAVKEVETIIGEGNESLTPPITPATPEAPTPAPTTPEPTPAPQEVAAQVVSEEAQDLASLVNEATPERIAAVEAAMAATPEDFTSEIEANTKELWARIQSGEKNLYTDESAPVVRAVGEALEAGKIASEQDVRDVINSAVAGWKEMGMAAGAFQQTDLSPQAELFRKQNLHYFNPDELKSVIPPSVPEVARMQEEGAAPAPLEDKLRAALSPKPDVELPVDLLTQSAEERIALAEEQQAQDTPDTTLSMKAGRNAQNYENPNNGVRLRELPVAWSSDGETKGPVRLTNVMPGQTLVVGHPSPFFQPGLIEAYGKLYDYLNRKFMGGQGKIVVILKSPRSAGQVQTSWHTKEGDVHIIQPPHGLMLKLTEQDVGQGLEEYNAVRKAQIALSSYHEFAHALVYDFIYSFIPSGVMKYLENETNTWEPVPQRYLDAIPNDLIRGVVQEYSDKKVEMVKNQASGLDFFREWMSPAKLNNAWLSKYGLGSDEFADMAFVKLGAMSAGEVTDRLEKRSGGKMQILSFPEYIAEQMVRWAYAGGSPLAVAQRSKTGTHFARYFAHVWEGLRKALTKIFVAAKKEKVIKPGTKFEMWLESLTKAPAVTPQEILGTGEGMTEVVEDIKVEETQKKVQRKVREDKRKEVKDREEKGVTAEDLRKALVAARYTPKDSEWKDVMEAFDAGDTAGAITILKEITGKPFRYDTPEAKSELQKIMDQFGLGDVGEAGLSEAQAKDPRVIERANHLFRFQKFLSPFFKNWFRKSQVTTFNGQPALLLTDAGVGFVPSVMGFVPLSRVPAGTEVIPFAVPKGYTLDAMEKLLRRELTPRMEAEVEKRLARRDTLQQTRRELEQELAKMRALQARQLSTAFSAAMESDLPVGVAEQKAWEEYYEGKAKQLMARMDGLEGMQLSIQEEINAILENPLNYSETRKPVAVYARIENPFVVQLNTVLSYTPMTSAFITNAIEHAKATGRDGVIVEGYPDGLGGATKLYLPLTIEQVKSDKALTFSGAKSIHFDWDQSNVHELNAAEVVQKARAVAPNTSLRRHFIRFIDALHAALQLQQIAQINPDIIGLQRDIAIGRKYTSDISVQLDVAQEAAEKVAALGKEMQGKLFKAMLDEARGGVMWLKREPIPGVQPDSIRVAYGGNAYQQAVKYRLVPTARMEEEFAKRGIDPLSPEGKEAMAAYMAMKTSLDNQLQFLKYSLQMRVLERYGDDKINVIAREWRMIDARFALIENVPFVPQQWFGNYMLVVKAKGDDGRWRVIHKQAWEDPKQYLEAAKELQAKLKPGHKLEQVTVSDKEYVLMALPAEFLYEVAEELNLTPEQLKRLQEFAQPLKHDKAVARYMNDYNVTGASEDLHRTFSAFSWHQANFIAKLRYRAQFTAAVSAVRVQMRVLEKSELMDPVEKYTQVERFKAVAREMQKAYDYLMSPEQELANFRAFIATLYLSFNPKTALLNLYGLLTTFSDLVATNGLVKGGATFVRALQYSVMTAREGWRLKDDGVQKAIDQARAEGVIHQSYAYMLAGQAIAPYWQRIFTRAFGKVDDLTGTRVGYSTARAGRKIIDMGMEPFRLFELMSRRATFIAKYLEGKQKFGDELQATDKAYEYAVRMTEELQSDWSRLNKPRIFRGGGILGAIVPAGTIFLSFAQHMAFHAFGGFQLGQGKVSKMEGNMRNNYAGYTMQIWLITLLVAGVKGLPGFENLFDILNWLFRHFFGKTAEQYVREGVQKVNEMNIPVLTMMTNDPMKVLYGLGHDVAGFDLSRSIGFGRMVPGTDVLTRPTDSPQALIGGTISSLMGPAGSTVYWMARWLNDPTYSNFAKLPGGIGSVLQAIDWGRNGARGPQGNLMIQEDGQARDVTGVELAGRFMGFRPTAVGKAQEAAFEAWDTKLYWQKRRQDVLELGRRAYTLKDREGIADFKTAWKDYNADVPKALPELRITGSDVTQSVMQRIKRVRMLEKGLEPDVRYRRLHQGVIESFEAAEEEGPE